MLGTEGSFKISVGTIDVINIGPTRTIAVFPFVTITASDPVSGESETFDIPIGEPQMLDPGSYHLLFTPRTGYTVTPSPLIVPT